MEKKKISPKDLKVNSKNVFENSPDATENAKDDKSLANCPTRHELECFLSTNVCKTTECDTTADECWPTAMCETKDCYSKVGCIETQTHLEACCPYTEEGDCPHTTDCESVAYTCESIQVCLISKDIACEQTFDKCLDPDTQNCEIATYADGGCETLRPTYDYPCRETRICDDETYRCDEETTGTDCMDETRTCGE